MAGSQIIKEAPNVLPDSLQKPADIYCPVWRSCRPAAFDITVTSPVRGDIIPDAARVAGFASRQAERRKDAKYLEACRQQGIDFIPLCVETFGAWGSLALSHFRTLIERLAVLSGRSRSQESTYFFQRLSIALQRCNGSSMILRAPRARLRSSYEGEG